MDLDKRMQISHTILAQLGGQRFLAMTGARDLSVREDGALQFRLPSRFARDGINCVRVTLDPSDTYTVSFYKVGDRRTGYRVTTVCEYSDIYSDSLQELFTRKTGLDTHL